MADIFSDMAAVATELLAPASEGGFGSGTIKLVRLVAGAAPANEWDPPGPPTRQEILLRANAFGVHSNLVGTEASPGVAILATDKRVISAPIPGGYRPADLMEIDGKPVTILQVKNIVGAGTTSAIQFLVR